MNFREEILKERKVSFSEFFNLKSSSSAKKNYCEEVDIGDFLEKNPKVIYDLVKCNAIKPELEEGLKNFLTRGDIGFGGIHNRFDARAIRVELNPLNLEALNAAFDGFKPVYNDIVKVSDIGCVRILKENKNSIVILGSTNIILKFKEFIDNFIKNFLKN